MAVVNDINAQAPHLPVLLGPVLAALEPRDGGIYVDGTFGAGGYSRAILEAAECTVIGIDRDPAARAAGLLLEDKFSGRETDLMPGSRTPAGDGQSDRHGLDSKSADEKSTFQLLEGRFSDMELLLEARLGNRNAGLEEVQSGKEVSRESAHRDFEPGLVDGVTLDIGVSSMQLDQAERGFSFTRDGPLDMRMSQSGLNAADVVNDFEPAQLRRIIKIYGEEKRAHAIAAAICRAREEKRFSTTRELAQLIEKVIGMPPGSRQRSGKSIHPATRTFQALRIFVNGELDELVRGLAAAERILKPGGRLAVVSFHSLEDRIVKKFLKRRTGSLPNPSRHAPMARQGDAASFRELVRGGETAGADEIAVNPRARSARLRSAVRTDAPAMALAETELAMGQIAGL